MTSRPPSRPPILPGFEHRSLLGSGGFADVFLYEQERPQRLVAVKALLASVSDPAVVRQFETEANVMAAMSTHPSIVTIHQTDVADDGRPCIVMEYCSRPGYGGRFRTETIPVAEVLSVGIRLAGAVETAHRAGILHRDIKPANILVTEYGRPALTDFGIATAIGEGGLDDNAGMSIPWAPPETFAENPGSDVRSDVWSLAATLYSLLARRTPFEEPRGRNRAADVIHRIETAPLRPIGRADVPASLNRVLSNAMAKRPDLRPGSALALGRALQQVEMELSLPVTSMDVLEDRAAPASGRQEDDDPVDAHTRIRAITVPDPTPAERAFAPLPERADAVPAGDRASADPFDAIAPAPEETSGRRGPRRAPWEGTAPTRVRPAAPGARAADEGGADGGGTLQLGPGAGPGGSAAAGASGTDADDAPRRRRRTWIMTGAAALVVGGLAVGSAVLVGRAFPDRPDPAPSATQAPYGIGDDAPTPVTDLRAQDVPKRAGDVTGMVRFSWKRPPSSSEQDIYEVQWQISEKGYDKFVEPVRVKGRSAVVLDRPPGIARPCATVRIIREDSQESKPAKVCVP